MRNGRLWIKKLDTFNLWLPRSLCAFSPSEKKKRNYHRALYVGIKKEEVEKRGEEQVTLYYQELLPFKNLCAYACN